MLIEAFDEGFFAAKEDVAAVLDGASEDLGLVAIVVVVAGRLVPVKDFRTAVVPVDEVAFEGLATVLVGPELVVEVGALRTVVVFGALEGTVDGFVTEAAADEGTFRTVVEGADEAAEVIGFLTAVVGFPEMDARGAVLAAEDVVLDGLAVPLADDVLEAVVVTGRFVADVAVVPLTSGFFVAVDDAAVGFDAVVLIFFTLVAPGTASSTDTLEAGTTSSEAFGSVAFVDSSTTKAGAAESSITGLSFAPNGSLSLATAAAGVGELSRTTCGLGERPVLPIPRPLFGEAEGEGARPSSFVSHFEIKDETAAVFE